jgi:hypothetical protein
MLPIVDEAPSSGSAASPRGMIIESNLANWVNWFKERELPPPSEEPSNLGHHRGLGRQTERIRSRFIRIAAMLEKTV